MNTNDNADRWNGRRDEELIPDGRLDYIEISFTAAWIDDVCRNPVIPLEAMRNRAKLLRKIGSDA